MKQKNYTQNQRIERLEKTVRSMTILMHYMQTEISKLKKDDEQQSEREDV